jgi:hypothetical protein
MAPRECYDTHDADGLQAFRRSQPRSADHARYRAFTGWQEAPAVRVLSQFQRLSDCHSKAARRLRRSARRTQQLTHLSIDLRDEPFALGVAHTGFEFFQE